MVTSLVVALATVLFVGGCGAPVAKPSTAAPLVLLPKDSNTVVTVALGQVVEIRLPANPSSGYRWDLDRLDANVLTPLGPPEFVPDPDKPGGAGITVFRFRGERVTNGMLRLVHRLPWEQAYKGETFTAMVRVR